jgi:zinc/manganese transport system substrate-binding protein
MHRRHLLAIAAASIAPLNARAAAATPIVATFSILADMTRRVAGPEIDVTSLVPVTGDAHVWEPKPADLRRVGTATVLVENGLGLEGWMTRLPQAAGFRGVRITASRDVKARSMVEDGRRIIDPHAWQDPRNGALYARAIADGLANALPAQSGAIRQRAADYIAEIEATDRWITETLAAIPPARRRILTSHDAFGYYGARFGITLRAVQGISTEGEPSARDIATLVGQIRREHIKAVFVETMTSPRLAEMVAHEAGATLGPAVYSDTLSTPDGPAATYLTMLRHNTTQFAAAMAAG